MTSHTWTNDALSVKGMCLSIGNTTLIESSDFTLPRGSRVALLGRNGCGKTTFFHWFTEHAKTAPWSIYEVAQELAPTSMSVIQVVLAAHIERGYLWTRQAELEQKEELSETELAEYTEIGEQLSAMKSEADPPRARKILHGLGFSAQEMERPVHELSGGWRARVALAQGLFMEPELLLLDEPTNHLDLNGVIWLTNFLKGWKHSFIVISHNIGFVSELSTTQWYIREKKLSTYSCSYSRFTRLRAEEEKAREKGWAALEKTLIALKKKNTPAAKKEASAVLAKRTAEGVRRPEKPYAPKFFFVESDHQAHTRVGPLITFNNAMLGYTEGTPILRDVTFSLHQGCRVALLGKNGSGKSTLLKSLGGEIDGLSSEYVHIRAGLRVCKFDQHFYHSLPDNITPLEYLHSKCDSGADQDILRKILGASGLEGTVHTRPIGSLSGGQKARVYFGSIAVQSPDILLMDEPTNHLDVETTEGLQSALKEFPGAAVVVSHDVDFLEGVATEVWVTRDGCLVRLSEGPEGIQTYCEDVLAEFEED